MSAFTTEPESNSPEQNTSFDFHNLALFSQKSAVTGLLDAIVCLPEAVSGISNTYLARSLNCLDAACSRNFPLFVAILLELGVDPNYVNENGNSAVHFAASNGSPILLRLLLRHGADFTRPNDQGLLPIHIAAQLGHIQALVWLLDVEGSVALDAVTRCGETVFHIVCSKGDRMALECLIKSHQLSLSNAIKGERFPNNPFLIQDESGNNCLHSAFLNKSLSNCPDGTKNCFKRHFNAARDVFWSLVTTSETPDALLSAVNSANETPTSLAKVSHDRALRWLVRVITSSTNRRSLPRFIGQLNFFLSGLHFLLPGLLMLLIFSTTLIMQSVLLVYLGLVLVVAVFSRQSHRSCDARQRPNLFFCGLFFFGGTACVFVYLNELNQHLADDNLRWLLSLPYCLGYPIWLVVYLRLLWGDPGRVTDQLQLSPKSVFRQAFSDCVDSYASAYVDLAKEILTSKTCPEKIPETPNLSTVYCASCDIVWSSQIFVKHCKLCNACFIDYDHHCLFLSNCVAGRNVRQFLWFLCITVVLCSFHFCISLVAVMNMCEGEKLFDAYPITYRFTVVATCALSRHPLVVVLLLSTIAVAGWLLTFIRSQFAQFIRLNSLLIHRIGVLRVLFGWNLPIDYKLNQFSPLKAV